MRMLHKGKGWGGGGGGGVVEPHFQDGRVVDHGLGAVVQRHVDGVVGCHVAAAGGGGAARGAGAAGAGGGGGDMHVGRSHFFFFWEGTPKNVNLKKIIYKGRRKRGGGKKRVEYRRR